MKIESTLTPTTFEKVETVSQNKTTLWHSIYDEHAASIYGLICYLTTNTRLAEDIFQQVFLQLKDVEEQIVSKTIGELCPFLLRHTYKSTIEQLTKRNINPVTDNPFTEMELIHLLCTRGMSLKEVAVVINTTEEDLRKKLRSVFLAIRKENGLNRLSQ